MNLTTSLIRVCVGRNSHQARLVTNSKYYISSTSIAASNKVTNESQGHVTDPSNVHKRDPQGQATRSGREATHPSNQALDSASPHPKEKPENRGRGNKEGIGLVDQVGGQSASARHFERKDNRQGSAPTQAEKDS